MLFLGPSAVFASLAQEKCFMLSCHLVRTLHELLSRDHETGNPLAGLSGAQRARIRWVCHRAPQGVGPGAYLNSTL